MRPRATNVGLERGILGLEAQLSSATASIYGSKKNPRPSAKRQHSPEGGKGEAWGLPTTLPARIRADHGAASPSHAWVGAQPGESRARLPASQCDITQPGQRGKQTAAAPRVSRTNRRFL